MFKKPLHINEYLESISSKDLTYDVVDDDNYIIATTWYKEVADRIKETFESE